MANRVSIRPSALGSKGFLLFAALELAFLATNYSNLFFLLLAFSAVLGVLGAWWSWRNLRDLQVESLGLATAASGSQRATHVHLAANRRPRFDLLVELDLEGGYCEVGYAPYLVKAQSIDDAVAGQPRGVRCITHARVTSSFPFGFFVARTTLPTDAELITYPTPIPFGESRSGGDRPGDHGALHAGRGTVLAGLRAFQTGDGMSDMHWKATARRGTPIVKERERESAPAVDVVLDRRCDEATLERALAQLTTLALAARTDTPLQVHSQGIELLVDPDRGGADDALRWLAEAKTLPSNAAPPPTRRSAMQLPEARRPT
ncbi:MAG: hypothetical protein ACI89X_001074 [Planctomycetota bacterium]|jgi:uncharacterized protein (DUF58 family)